MINTLSQVFYRRPHELCSLDQKPASLCSTCSTQPGRMLQVRLSVTGTPSGGRDGLCWMGPWG